MTNHAGTVDALCRSVYRAPALVPACPWLEKTGPARPVLTVRENRKELKLVWKEPLGEAWQWVVRKKTDGRWTTEILPASKTKEVLYDAPGALGRKSSKSQPSVVAAT